MSLHYSAPGDLQKSMFTSPPPCAVAEIYFSIFKIPKLPLTNKCKKFTEFINLNNCSQSNKIITKHINIPPYKTRRVRVHNFDFSTVDLDPTNSSDFHTKKVKTSFFFFDLKCYSSNIGNAELQALQMATR